MKYCWAITSGYAVELVCSKHPYGSWISRVSASVRLASGVGYTAMLVARLPPTSVSGMVTVWEAFVSALIIPPNARSTGNPKGFTASLRVTLSEYGPAWASTMTSEVPPVLFTRRSTICRRRALGSMPVRSMSTTFSAAVVRRVRPTPGNSWFNPFTIPTGSRMRSPVVTSSGSFGSM